MLAAAAATSERTAADPSQDRELKELLRQRDAARQQLTELSQEGAGSELAAAGNAARARARVLSPLLVCSEGCGRSFAGARALGGHLRHCAARRERLRQRELGAVISRGQLKRLGGRHVQEQRAPFDVAVRLPIEVQFSVSDHLEPQAPIGWSSACFFRRVNTVSNPTPAETATKTADTNCILSVAPTVVAEGARTPGAPTH